MKQITQFDDNSFQKEKNVSRSRMLSLSSQIVILYLLFLFLFWLTCFDSKAGEFFRVDLLYAGRVMKNVNSILGHSCLEVPACFEEKREHMERSIAKWSGEEVKKKKQRRENK